MKRARWLVAVLAVAVLAGCNDAGLPPGGTYSSMQGTVTDALSNQPIPNATITVETVLTAQTQTNGTFSFAQIPVGEVDYTVSAPGYKTFSSSANAAPGKPLVVTVTLSH